MSINVNTLKIYYLNPSRKVGSGIKMSNLSDSEIAGLKESLLLEKQELIHDAELSAGDRQAVVLDQTSVGRLSRMDALQSQAMALETGRRREVELRRIELALERIKNDEYGYCQSCDEEIPTKRLEMDPATPICVECANKNTSKK